MCQVQKYVRCVYMYVFLLVFHIAHADTIFYVTTTATPTTPTPTTPLPSLPLPPLPLPPLPLPPRHSHHCHSYHCHSHHCTCRLLYSCAQMLPAIATVLEGCQPVVLQPSTINDHACQWLLNLTSFRSYGNTTLLRGCGSVLFMGLFFCGGLTP